MSVVRALERQEGVGPLPSDGVTRSDLSSGDVRRVPGVRCTLKKGSPAIPIVTANTKGAKPWLPVHSRCAALTMSPRAQVRLRL